MPGKRRITCITPSELEPISPVASSRYTPQNHSVRLRPGWHKIVGGVILTTAAMVLIVGLTLVVLNEALLNNLIRLPSGGHSELYLMAGVIMAGYGTWWLGLFDRDK